MVVIDNNNKEELYRIDLLSDPYIWVIKDDPVRGHIPTSARVNKHSRVFILKEGERPLAATCVKWTRAVPKDEGELEAFCDSSKNIAVFYTIWSYQPGAAARLLFKTAECIRAMVGNNTLPPPRIVTLSPPTDMARDFHLRNGASILRYNETSVNYEYP